MKNSGSPVQDRWFRRRRRADIRKWIVYILTWIGGMVLGLWVGLRLGAERDGLYIGAGTVFVCLFYAVFILTWHLKSLVRAERGIWQNEEARITRLLQPLCDKAEIHMPGVFIISTEAVNACAAGILPRRRYVGVTLGALRKMTDDELSGVLAHEVTHLTRKDALFDGWWIALTGLIQLLSAICVGMGIAMVVSGARSRKKNEASAAGLGFAMILGGLVFGIVAVFVIQVILHSVMRRAEYMADNGAVLLTGRAKPLISALQKLNQNNAMLNQHSALSMLFAVEPTVRHSWWDGLFSTHPRTSKRIARLKKLSQELGEV